ncbi:MAG: rod shape-determining protein [Firmicutes bacterium]|nr:rod shape-determining protein [Bacillota bacterium]
MTKDIAVLDFGSGQVTALVGKRGAAGILDITGRGEAEYAGFCDGAFLRPELLSQAVSLAITAAETAAGNKIKHLFIGVPAEFSTCVVREASVSFGKKHKVIPADLENMYRQGDDFSYVAEGFTLVNRQPIYYSLDNDRRIIDPVGKTTTKLSGLMSYILAEHKFTYFVDNIMENLGVQTAEYVSSPLAEAMFLFGEQMRDTTAVLVDVGYITSFVAVVRGDGLLALSSFSLGGGHIAGDLTRYFGISFSEAEALKRKAMISLTPADDDVYEIRGKQFEAGLVNKIVSARLSTIGRMIQKCLAACKYELPAGAFYGLTGGGVSYMRGAKEFLSQAAGKEFEAIAPPIPQMEKPELSSSLGLLNMVLDADVPTKRKKEGFWGKLFK